MPRFATRLRRPSPATMGQERGFAAIEFVAGVALLLVPAVMLVTSIATWFEARHNATAIAAELGTYVANDAGGCGMMQAHVVALQTAGKLLGAARGIAPERVRVEVNQPRRGQPAVVRVRVAVPATHLPMIGSIGEFHISREHHSRVDPYRRCP